MGGRLRGGFEPPPNAGVTILCLNHLTTAARFNGASLGIRTPPDLRLRRPLLYPAELVTRIFYQLMERCMRLTSIVNQMVGGVAGFEPATSGPKPDALPNCATPPRQSSAPSTDKIYYTGYGG